MAPLLELAALRLVRGSSGCTCQGGRTGGGETIAVRAENRVNGAAPSFQTNICLIPIEIDTKKGKVGHWCGSARAGWLAGASQPQGLLVGPAKRHQRQPRTRQAAMEMGFLASFLPSSTRVSSRVLVIAGYLP